MGIEFELKFRADETARQKIREAFPGPWQEIRMNTRYYDTEALALSAKHWTLRRRTENGRSVCTVKTPASGGARGEWETECNDIAEALPELCRLGAPEDLKQLAGENLHEICGAEFTRLALTVPFEDCTVEIALDGGKLTGGGREEKLSEAETELKSGSREAAVRFGTAFAERFGLVPEPKSKFRRALALAKGE